MMTLETAAGESRFLVSGDEAGTAPSDRRFRPDVEGLRAVAILLVVLFHADVPGLTGGYIGVDVFFVISGFVITGVLLRERSGTGGTSILDFYARRCRRILPAATLVILIAVLFSYALLGFLTGNSTADDGRWAAAFLANFHFEFVGTNYFTATASPSALQNYWSLSVEEQFYVIYPTLFLVVAMVKLRYSLRARLVVLLGTIVIASYWLSIVQTASNPTAAYFSPFDRAWELALGALVAVSTTWLKQIPAAVAAILTWAGLGAILIAAFIFDAQTAYPGSLVAVPVVGAGLIIAGGAAMPVSGAESVLATGPLQWLGRRSYSLYLWHWPILVIVADWAKKPRLSVGENLLLLVVAMGLSMVTYVIVENPIRHLRVPSAKTVVAGVSLVIVTIVILSLAISSHSASGAVLRVIPAANTEAVLSSVAAAPTITRVPTTIQPPLSDAPFDFGANSESARCNAGVGQSSESICTLGDPKGKRLMVLYGDSHALMWLQAFDGLAKASHWRLVVLGKSSCPGEMLTFPDPPGFGTPRSPFEVCNAWHAWAVAETNRLHPNMVVLSSENFDHVNFNQAGGKRHHHHHHRLTRVGSFTPAQWQQGIATYFNRITVPGVEKVFLGNIPALRQSGPDCLAAHPTDAQSCSDPLDVATQSPTDQLERSEAARLKIQYIDPTPWFCSTTCTAIIGHFDVYLDRFHVTNSYATYLQNALAHSLGVMAK